MFLCFYCSLFNNLMFKVDTVLILKSHWVMKAKVVIPLFILNKHHMPKWLLWFILPSYSYLSKMTGSLFGHLQQEYCPSHDQRETVLLVRCLWLGRPRTRAIKVVNIYREVTTGWTRCFKHFTARAVPWNRLVAGCPRDFDSYYGNFPAEGSKGS